MLSEKSAGTYTANGKKPGGESSQNNSTGGPDGRVKSDTVRQSKP